MNYRDLHRELKAGNIVIDYKGHLCNDAVPGILRQIEHLFDGETATDVSKDMQEYYTNPVLFLLTKRLLLCILPQNT